MTDTTPEPEDYTGEDGLLYCGKCHKPKEGSVIIRHFTWLLQKKLLQFSHYIFLFSYS